MKSRLFSRNFTLIIGATVIGAAGGIAGNLALSFFVFEETGSTLATAILTAIQLLPSLLVPLIASPFMDRHRRKPFLVAGDAINGLIYLVMGIWLLNNDFSYGIYICFSLLLSCLNIFDSLAFHALFPTLIPQGCEEKGFTVSSMVYPVLNVVMSPVAAMLLEKFGVAWILIGQSVLSMLAAFTESFIDADEPHVHRDQPPFSFRQWVTDIREALAYIRSDKALSNIFLYASFMNGIDSSHLEVAYFSTAPGLSIAMYSLFTTAQFIGRSIGGIFCFRGSVPYKKRYKFILFVYHCYELLDAMLLWLPYPLMLVNRAFSGFLGMNSWNIRYSAVQAYIPDEYRARVNALSDVLNLSFHTVLSLIMGAMGEFMDYRLVLTVMGLSVILVCRLTVCRNREETGKIFCYNPNLPAAKNS